MSNSRGQVPPEPGAGRWSAEAVADALNAQARGRSGAALRSASSNPIEAIRVFALSHQQGIPAETAARNLPKYERQAKIDSVQESFNRYPMYEQWARDPRNTPHALADNKNLSSVSELLSWRPDPASSPVRRPRAPWAAAPIRPLPARKPAARVKEAPQWRTGKLARTQFQAQLEALGAYRQPVRHLMLPPFTAEQDHLEYGINPFQAPKPTIGNIARGIWVSIVDGGRNTRGSIHQVLFDHVPSFDLSRSGTPSLKNYGAENARREIEQSTARIAAARPEFESAWAQNLYDAGSTIAQSAIPVGLGLVLGAPATIGAAGAGFVSYGKYRAMGAKPNEAALGGAADGAITLVGGKVFGRLAPKVDRFIPAPGGIVGEIIGNQIPSDAFTTIGTNATDAFFRYHTASEKERKQTDFWGQYINEQPGKVLSTILINAPTQLLFKRAQHRMEGWNGGDPKPEYLTSLDAVMERASYSSTRTQDPVAFRQLVNGLTRDTPIETVRIPAWHLEKHFRQAKIDPAASAFWRNHLAQIEEAKIWAGDIAIPTADVITYLTDTPTWKAVRDKARLFPANMESMTSGYEGSVRGAATAELTKRQRRRQNGRRKEARAKTAEPVARETAGVPATAASNAPEVQAATSPAVAKPASIRGSRNDAGAPAERQTRSAVEEATAAVGRPPEKRMRKAGDSLGNGGVGGARSSAQVDLEAAAGSVLSGSHPIIVSEAARSSGEPASSSDRSDPAPREKARPIAASPRPQAAETGDEPQRRAATARPRERKKREKANGSD